jgi:hypothetical protein
MPKGKENKMPSIFKQEELIQVKGVCEHWLKYFAGEDYIDDEHNRDVMLNYIKFNLKGEVTTQTLNQARDACYANLHGLGVARTPAQLAAKAAREKAAAEQQRQERLAAALQHTVTVWLDKHCPLGLKASNGEPFEGDVHRIIEYLKTNYGPAYQNGQITVENLNAAVETLAPVLTWFSNDREIRNKPVPPPRKLSEKALIEAGMKIARDPRNHARDGQFTNPASTMRKIVKKLVGHTDPDLIKADQISVINGKTGKVDHSFTAELRKIKVFNKDGSVNGRETLRLRNAAADEYIRRSTRDHGQRG